MSNYRRPSPAEQLRFLSEVQRLLTEGAFVATYKFALLHAIADLCVELGQESSGAPFTLKTEDLARRFVQLYEPHTRPYPAGAETRVLRQNTGRPAQVVTVVAEATERYAAARQSAALDPDVIRKVDRTIRQMPLWKLQTVGSERRDFLYDNVGDVKIREITLKPGIAYCFREFHGLLLSLIRDRWELMVRRCNRDVLGERADLHEFLFGSERSSLQAYREILFDLQKGRCFYTGRSLGRDYDVDHFIPWTRFPADLGHNFVLATKVANSSKSDMLAAEEHLDRWLRFCVDHRDVLAKTFETRRLAHSLKSSLSIAEWSYSAVQRTGGQVWVKGKEMRELSDRWQEPFTAARRAIGDVGRVV